MGGHAGHAVDEPVGAVGLLVTRAEVARSIHLFEEELPELLILCFGGETKVFVNKLFMHKLVERGERAQKDAGQWMKDVQARFL